MKSYVWDTGGLTLYFVGHKKSKNLMDDCLNRRSIGIVPQIILLELYYLQWREFGKRIAKFRIESLVESNLKIVAMDRQILFSAGEIKVKFANLSIVDSILVATGRKTRSIIITTEVPISKIKDVKTLKMKW